MKRKISLILCIILMLSMCSICVFAEGREDWEICPTQDPTIEQMAAFIMQYQDAGADQDIRVAFEFSPGSYTGYDNDFRPLMLDQWSEYLFTVFKSNLYGMDYQTASFGTNYSYYPSTGEIIAYWGIMDFTMTTNAALKPKIDEIAAAAKAASQDKTQQVKYVYDYLRQHIVYDESVQKDSGSETALLKGKSVCMGFSRAFGEICRELNVPCVYVCSETHMWNTVYLNGVWKHVDVTQKWWLKDDGFFPMASSDNDHKYDKKYMQWGRAFLLGGLTGDAHISGDAQRGRLLTMNVTASTNDTLQYEWRRNDIKIPGATESTYRLTAADVGKRVSCVVSAKNGYGKLKDATAIVSDLAPGEHIWDDGVVTTPSTCTKTGTVLYTCLDCGATKTETLPKAQHTWDGGAVTTRPTCTLPGEKTVTCTVCGATSKEEIPATGHQWNAGIVTVPPGCTTEGVREYTCTVCLATRQDPISAKGHTWKLYGVEKPATCAEVGSALIYCEACGAIDHQALPKLEHTWDSGVITRQPTCSVPGVKLFTCTACGGTQQVEIATTAHTWAKDYTVDKPATEKENGSKSIHCTVCNAIKPGTSVVLPKKAKQNTFKDVPAKAWFRDAVYYTVDEGIFAGITPTTFCPNDDMTRAMFVATLSRIAGVKVNNKAATVFSDVKSGQWYTGAVKWASDNNIVKGANGKFSPNDPITREQICTIMVSYCLAQKTKLYSTTGAVVFLDQKKISKWASSAVTICQCAGLVAGSNGYFNPQGKASRAQVAQILATFHKNFC